MEKKKKSLFDEIFKLKRLEKIYTRGVIFPLNSFRI